jgi:hypothetical protein
LLALLAGDARRHLGAPIEKQDSTLSIESDNQNLGALDDEGGLSYLEALEEELRKHVPEIAYVEAVP